ncbi:MAG TPA: thioredoxin family protein [Gemmatimonadales bacterium]|jgi:thiol-disulfide isomerase/thioredoxin|nr:thioredoxin family protein [Gemmatimonadales bacterium]
MSPAQRLGASALAVLGAFASSPLAAQGKLVHVTLEYRAPGDGHPAPNFSPKGTQVALVDVAANATLPPGAMRPAKSGMIKVGPDRASWIPVLATSCDGHPADLCQLFLDRNRNGNFADDGPPLIGAPTQNAKTHAWWTSVNKVELSVLYANKKPEPYLVNFWLVRDDSAAAPDVLRYSVGSWRYGTATINGVPALVAAMDADNDAIFTRDDSWSVLGAAEPGAEKAVLSINEARPTNRLMFVPSGGKDLVLQFRSFSPDGRSVDFAVIDRPVTKLQDRGPDDLLKDERSRPRTVAPVVWGHGSKDFDAAVAKARTTGLKVLLDFEATWCGPCHTMDQWIWNDADVARQINAGYLGVKIDVDLEKGLVKRFQTRGYPTMILLDPAGKELKRVEGYQSSREMLALLSPRP